MKVDLLLSLWLSHHLEILDWQYWQHPCASMGWERHLTAQLCPVHSCKSSAALQVQGRLFPHPIASKHDYLSSLQSPAGSSFCLDAWLAVPALDMTPAASDPLRHLLHASSCSGDEHRSLFSFTASVAGSFLAAHLFAGPPTPTFSHQTPL